MKNPPARTPDVRRITRSREVARQIAETAADRYFAALVADIPFDTAPGDVNLVNACNEVYVTLLKGRPERTKDAEIAADWREDAALRAGYLLGIAIGRRIGGAQ